MGYATGRPDGGAYPESIEIPIPQGPTADLKVATINFRSELDHKLA
jgi:hypothetical protein